MAKLGNKKLSKLRSMLKRLTSLSGKLAAAAAGAADIDACRTHDDLRAVYVGKFRRRYLITSLLAEHPSLQLLLRRPDRGGGGGNDDDDGGSNDGDIVVGCEVVLFEHLLWMLENGEGGSESLDELVGYYAC